MEWDMSGMTLATTGQDGMVRLWQSNLNGVWHQQAAFEPTSQPPERLNASVLCENESQIFVLRKED